MNRLLIVAFAPILTFASFAAEPGRSPSPAPTPTPSPTPTPTPKPLAGRAIEETSARSAWNRPWARDQKTALSTLFAVDATAIMRRDQAVADRQIRILQQRAQIAFERRHKAQLENYVETRLALAEERARVELIRATQLADLRRTRTGGSPDLDIEDNGAGGLAVASVAGAWVPGERTTRARPPQPIFSGQELTETARHIVKNIPKRTKQILDGNDELVTSNLSHGLPKGLAVFLALLMLHVPSVALASLVTGVFLIRGHQPRAGVLFLGLSAILGVIVFSLMRG